MGDGNEYLGLHSPIFCSKWKAIYMHLAKCAMRCKMAKTKTKKIPLFYTGNFVHCFIGFYTVIGP